MTDDASLTEFFICLVMFPVRIRLYLIINFLSVTRLKLDFKATRNASRFRIHRVHGNIQRATGKETDNKRELLAPRALVSWRLREATERAGT